MFSHFKKVLAGVVAFVAAALVMPAADGATSTANMAVAASIANNCTMQAANLNFPSYTGAVSPDTASTQVSWTCSAGAPSTLTFTSANFAAGNRQLKNGANVLTYQLCNDLACLSPLPNNTALTIGGAVLTCTASPCTINGSIAGSQSVAVSGSYSDTVTMTLTF
ncbi:MAG TPA: spore coat protein U domain-containing protein [Stellaceae bacterium]|nr:spore coat protein U domain-containing protein [Stellaceae bacterium]HXQ51394.1 spore coat protein U domain-containing protein [Stellaceae bacterium]